MLTLKAINENPEEIVRRLSKKHFDGKAIIDEVIALDAVRRESQTSLDAVLAEINCSVGRCIHEGGQKELTSPRKGRPFERVIKSLKKRSRMPKEG